LIRQIIENVHYYLENGRVVFTALYHLDNKECCGNDCRHCPYDPLWTKGATKINKIESED
jgi:hypothetical protein